VEVAVAAMDGHKVLYKGTELFCKQIPAGIGQELTSRTSSGEFEGKK